ncbi:MAG: NAD(+) diphosphatase [Oscillospiraceae bacterium]|nr:NAD(+) diphosphatase [Oscillospiraceae bacterium]
MVHEIFPKKFDNQYRPEKKPGANAFVTQFVGRDLLCRVDENELQLPRRKQFSDGDEAFIYLFSIDADEYYLLHENTRREMEGWSYRDINLFRNEKPQHIAYAGVSAWHLYCWYRDSEYCGRCGTKAEHDGKERMMHCPKCGNMMFPRIMPSVIVGVINGDSILLTQYNRPGAKRTALIAGFTEFGETIEETVTREVMEEVGLKVKNLRYYKSQPWGISGGGLLFGFWCEVDGDGTITIDGVELADAAWVSREELQRDFVDTGIALTGEMIRVFSEGREK